MKMFHNTQPVLMSVELSQGSVEVIATDRTDVVVAVNPSDRDQPDDIEAARKTAVDLTDGVLTIRTPKHHGIIAPLLGWKRDGSVAVTVQLPERSSLHAYSGFTEFRGAGRLAEVDLTTGAGDVRLDRTGPLRVRSGAGRVTIEEVSGSAEIETAGEITVDAVSGDAEIGNRSGTTAIGRVDGAVRVKSANGDITIDEAGGDITAQTANGRIRLGQVVRGNVSIETGSGEVEVGVGPGSVASIDASTKFGRVDDQLVPAGDEPDASADTVQIRARTSFGDIVIAQAKVPIRLEGS